MFEYFKLKTELQDCKEASIALVNENRELRNKIANLQSQITNYVAQDNERHTAQEEHRQLIIAKLEDQFLISPQTVLLDAIKYYKGGVNYPYIQAYHNPTMYQALMQAGSQPASY